MALQTYWDQQRLQHADNFITESKMGQWIKDYKVSMKTKIVSCEKYQEREHDSCDLIAKMELLKTFIEWLMKNEKYMAELCVDLIECCFI